MNCNPNLQSPCTPRNPRPWHRRIGFLLWLLASTMVLGTANIYAGSTALVSVNNAGEQGNAPSVFPRALSRNGRFVCFESAASNLVLGDTNGQPDIFVHDRKTRETARVSISNTGEQANSLSNQCALSADGRYFAFFSEATNLVRLDTNGRADVFVHDRKTGETTRVSISSTGEQANGGSDSPAISADGRLVAFRSNASNLVFGDTNGFDDIFLHNRQNATTTRVSVNSSGEQAIGCVTTCQQNPSLSADGRFVAFDSRATNLVPMDTNDRTDIFVHDLRMGETVRVSVNSLGFEGNADSFIPSLSADGRIVAFGSEASNLVNGDTNELEDAFVYDFKHREITRVSVSTAGLQANAGSFNYALSSNGRYVSFNSGATNLVRGDNNGRTDIFVHDRKRGKTTRVSVDSFGNEGNGDSAVSPLSRNGRFIAFGSSSSNLVNGDTNRVPDSFIHDRHSRRGVKDDLFPDKGQFDDDTEEDTIDE